MSKNDIDKELEDIKNAFDISEINDFNIKLLKYDNDENSDGIKYELFPIVFKKEEIRQKYIKEILKKYKSILKDIKIEQYTGENNYLSFIKVDKKLIETDFDKLIDSINNCEHQASWTEFDTGYVLEINNNYFISLASPIKTYKHNYKSSRNNEFDECNEPFLSLSNKFDILIINNNIYFLNQKAEELFNMIKTFNNVREKYVDYIEKSNIVSNIDIIKDVSSQIRYTRLYINFKSDKLDYIKNKKNLSKISKQFNINLINNKVDGTDEKSVKNFIKFLCNKGMIDPCDSSSVEVSNAKKW